MTEIIGTASATHPVKRAADIRAHIVYRMSLFTTIADRNGKVFFLTRFGLTLREYRIVGVIGYMQPVGLVELADECYLDKGQVSRLVGKLIVDGLVERSLEGSDPTRSAQVLKLTKRGKALLSEALAYGDELNAETVSMLTETELHTLSTALDKVIAIAKLSFDRVHRGSQSKPEVEEN
jgi:DNA-binding MarR family transcriptional regulator